ncbi:variable large family protein [Borrelia hermsii]|uniref:Variable large protein 7 n=5 Tax=Borrelia hermsii TaxID=140 RepID=VLP7_BORHE|nr:variable large family protein [Borrelia hermsii]P21876.1 RecName: Full=Variable large protein 7; AltName: Full=Variable major outer membrane lipoprotein 7; Flags: Precursor [Borrelia hermsii]AAZ94629.1 Vlp7 [Borrelia hermsii]ABC55440.1 Vmp7 outer membrane lipoprotein [Borrelia hermsii]ABF82167.1 VlpA7H [Borrelia hermsii DAH]AMR76106.1 Variable large protein 7 [Borrelia hermsii]ANA43889.1 VlpA7 [Borrelia hermsii HS1]
MRKRISAIINKLNISIIIMTVVLMIGCGQQPEAGKTGVSGGVNGNLGNSLMELGRSAENAFYAFIELVSDVLGFTAKSDTTKQEVGGYFNSLGAKLGEASNDLEQVAVKAETGVDKSDSSKNPIREAVNEAKEVLGTLKGYVESLGTIGDSNPVGYANNAAGSGTTAADDELRKAFKALQEIVKAATDAGVKALKIGATTLQANGGADNKEGAKILATSGGNPAAADVAKAAAILSSVSGEEMLSSIVKSGENDAQLAAAADGNTSAISFAKGGSDAHLAGANTPKAAAVAGGIALRSLVKTGKLAAGAADNATGGGKEVQGVGVAAANKLLRAVEDVIKKTVKNVLEKAKEKIDKARGSQEPVSESSK